MTIHLTCTQCQRKLNVPDSALGKKIQCPACGTRFPAQLEPSQEPASVAALTVSATHPTAGTNADAAFLATEEPNGVGEKAHATQARPFASATTASSAAKHVTNKATDEEIDVNEAVDGNDPSQPKKKPRKRASWGCLLSVCLFSLLVIGLAVGGYYYSGGYIPDSAWKTIKHEDRSISIKMPGDPVRSVDESSKAGTDVIRYTVNKPLAFSEFSLSKYDRPGKEIQPDSLDRLIDESADTFCNERGGTVEEKKASDLGWAVKGREARINMGLGRYAILRCYIYQRKNSDRATVYELVSVGPFIQSNKGASNQFLNSFSVLVQTPPGAPGGPPRQAAGQGQRQDGGQRQRQGEQKGGGQPKGEKKEKEKI